MRHYSRIPILLLIVGLLASLWSAGRRVAVERAGRTVELTIDLDQYRSLALSLGIPIAEWGFGGAGGVYHSQYDDLAWMSRFGACAITSRSTNTPCGATVGKDFL